MGVHELWDIVGPTARPVRLEALRNKRLAVDASIWIYQFLKAVRDKEGNPMRNAHIVGFFRRICKLLYFGIKPVFIFDGGVPLLKKDTIRKRKERREGQRESTERTAHRLLAKRLQRVAELRNSSSRDDDGTGKVRARSSALKKEVPIGELEFGEYYDDHNYLGGEDNTPKQAKEQESRIFRRQDDYDLPQIDEFKVDKNDERMVTDYEYDRLTNDVQEDMDRIDLENIDPKSAEFDKLPLSTQYIVLSHLRLRSRLRMGYTKDQLEALFPDSMEFSKFQIQMVQKRNYFTQRMMNVSGMDKEDPNVIHRRIVGEKDREYSLQRTEGGYVLSINKENENEGRDVANAISVEEEEKEDESDESGTEEIEGEVDDEIEDQEDDSSDSSIQWEDVLDSPPIRLSKSGLPVAPSVSHPTLHESVTAFMDPSIHNGGSLFVEGAVEGIEKEDAIMEKIKSLYEYADKQRTGPKKAPTPKVSEVQDGVDVSTVPEISEVVETSSSEVIYDTPVSATAPVNPTVSDANQSVASSLRDASADVPTEQLKRAIEESKKDYLDMLEKEKDPFKPVSAESKQPPIILDKRSLEKSLKLPKFGESLLARKGPESKPKALPLPDWFENTKTDSTRQRFEPDIGVNRSVSLRQETEDEKAGLHKFVEVEDLLSESDDDEVEGGEKDQPIVLSDEEEKSIEDVPDKTDMSVDVQEKAPERPPQSVTDLLVHPKTDIDYEFSEDEEEQLHQNLEEEEAAYGKFVDQLSGKSSKLGSMWSMDEEVKLQEQLRKQKRDSDEVSTNMILDVQDLLSRFGIPFITAPMEAEAQCAELEGLQLVDGIVTDDSDCFLFGGGKIYKNMFNEKNYVECYQLEDIERDMGLKRLQLIEIAIMLGSDYTEGLKGVGKVTAVEILAEFKNLENFRKWWVDYQNGEIDKSRDNRIRKKLRKQLGKSLYLNEDFPSQDIYEAYLHPEVDHDKTAFKWGYPNLDKLRTFMMYNVGWPQSKVDQILLPIIKDLNKPQQTIEEFFPVELVRKRREIMMGKRLREATGKLRGEDDGGDGGAAEHAREHSNSSKRSKRA
ncbi:DEKNAAC101557 [Brettanomyces naardenensis]|uniref:DEKNAAC101557 n=1 Tax=Brettanomyces naardenensis TaxID=13370 RepID=A0A448YIM0_BRENA|nr:DEKNAAC101557 [Brettanomyces naardenensis]